LPHIITSKVEHASVLKPCEDLANSGKARITYLDVDKDGIVNLKQFKRSLKKETILVSIIYVNNETGAVQPIKEIAEIISEFKQEKLKIENQGRYAISDLQLPFFHTDAAQALGHLKDIDLQDLGVDFMSVSGHKIYGPKGIGVLLMADSSFSIANGRTRKAISGQRSAISPLITGGSQEFGLRAGTENVPVIVGFAKAIKLADGFLSEQSNYLKTINQEFIKKIKKIYPKAVVNSSDNSVPEILNISFPGLKSEELIYQFDKFGIAVSGGAACEAKSSKPSYVLKATGLPERLLNSAIRFSFGRKTAQGEVNYVFAKLSRILNY
jgi:cysteine desulfurase